MHSEPTVVLRLGDYADVVMDDDADSVITDTPYCAKCQAGHDSGTSGNDGGARRRLPYAPFGEADARVLVMAFAPRITHWLVVLTCDHLWDVYHDAAEALGLYAFHRIPIVYADSRRQMGDGPASAAVYLMAARPSTKAMSTWGSLRGFYTGKRVKGEHVGGKDIDLMRQIVGDYTNPGDLVVDPCAGYATTLLAARELGCSAIGAELDETTHAMATARLAKPYQPTPHPRAGRLARKGQRQHGLFDEVSS